MNRTRNIVSRPTLLRAIVILGLLTAGVCSTHAQEATVPTEPLASVQRFKLVIDAEDIRAMCELMAEPDSSGPLLRAHYESTQASIEGLVSLWKGASFTYGSVSVVEGSNPPSATVQATIAGLKQRAVFSLLRFGGGWYIRDIEIYFQ